jgi:hypothetical protein
MLMGGALGVFGHLQPTSIGPVFLKAPWTESQQQGVVVTEPAAGAFGDLVVARGREERQQPCIPTVPIAFSTQVAILC